MSADEYFARAIVRDRFSGSELVQNMAVVTAIFAIGPVVAPLLGYALLSFHAWQTAFVAMLVFGAGLGALAWRSSETLARPSPEALQPRELKRRAARVLGHPQSRWFLLLSAVAMMSIMAYLTQAPLLFVDALGASKLAFVVYFALSGAGIVVGQIANRRLIARLGAVSASITGAVVLAASATSVLVLDVLGLLTPLTLCACMTAFNTSYLVVYANAVSLVLDPHGAIAGFTASFVGFAGPVVAASVVVPLTFWIDGRVVPWGLFMLAVSLGCLAMLLVWRGRAGRLIEAQPQE